MSELEQRGGGRRQVKPERVESGEETLSLGRLQGVGLMRIRRERQLNALSLGTVQALHRAMDGFEADEQVRVLWIEGAGEKAFCAGGDVRAAWDALDETIRPGGELPLHAAFFRHEYLMNRRIRTLVKPYVAWLDGIVMGGGVGVSIHGDFSVATENTLWAMPEAGIGLFPDVGVCHELARLPGELGTYLALTGARIGAADLIHAEIASHYIPAERHGAVLRDLALIDWAAAPSVEAEYLVGEVLDNHARDPGPSVLEDRFDEIDELFQGDTLEEIFAALAAAKTAFARECLETLRKRSPTSLKLTLHHLREAFFQTFDEVLVDDYRLSQFFMTHPDFREGIRAVLVDRDHAPRWQPDSIDKVGPDVIAKAFATPRAGDLPLPDDGE